MSVIPGFTPEERVAIRHHLGFVNVAEAATFALGVPASLETQFMIERAMTLALPDAMGRVRTLLARCENCEAQLDENTENLAVTKVGGIELRDDEMEKVMERYRHWRDGIANALGISANPYDKREWCRPATLNAPVRG